jgi:hypothetical protein
VAAAIFRKERLEILGIISYPPLLHFFFFAFLLSYFLAFVNITG